MRQGEEKAVGNLMEEYRYPKSGYTRFAIMLIYGSRSKHHEQFSTYNIFPPPDSQRLRYSEVENAREASLGPGINACLRRLSFGDGRTLSSTITQGTGINTVLVYDMQVKDPALASHNTYVGNELLQDVMFSQDEYEYFNFHWDDQVQYKVDALSRLIRTLDTGDLGQRPTFLADFPTIARFLIAYPDCIPVRDSLWA